MDQATVIDLAVKTILVAIEISAPMLGAGLLVGVLLSILMSVTQIQEATLTFIPKLCVVLAVGVIAGPWMMDTLMHFTINLYQSIPAMVGP